MPTLQSPISIITSNSNSNYNHTITETKKRILANKLIQYKGNQTEAFADVYPNFKTREALSTFACETLKNHSDIRRYALEILQSKSGTTLDALIKRTEGDLDSTKEVLDGKGRKVSLKDNATAQEAQRILYRLYGLWNTETQQAQVNIQNNLSIQADPAELQGILQELKAISSGIASSNKEQTGAST
jgi:hypothetical protein